MQAPELSRAVAAALGAASALGLAARGATVLSNSNRLAVRLSPCDVLARVASLGEQSAQFEVDLARRLAESGSPVGALASCVDPRVHERDGFVVTLWTYYPPAGPGGIAPLDYAKALQRLHAGMRTLDAATPHFTDRAAWAQRVVADRSLTPALADDDRELLAGMLASRRSAIGARGAAEQPLHGEPHPGNLLSTTQGPLFIDLETCCRGPVEFDLAHAPADVADHYAGADQGLLGECRGLVLAMVAAWRWEAGDEFPNGRKAGRDFIGALREGPPWPTLDAVVQGAARR